jgi:hypothetical protein
MTIPEVIAAGGTGGMCSCLDTDSSLTVVAMEKEAANLTATFCKMMGVVGRARPVT